MLRASSYFSRSPPNPALSASPIPLNPRAREAITPPKANKAGTASARLPMSEPRLEASPKTPAPSAATPATRGLMAEPRTATNAVKTGSVGVKVIRIEESCFNPSFILSRMLFVEVNALFCRIQLKVLLRVPSS